MTSAGRCTCRGRSRSSSSRIDADTRALSAEPGRSPTPLELAERSETTVEQVLEALAARTAHHADSLDRPLSEEAETAMDLLGGQLDPGYSYSEDATFVNSLLATLPEREREVLRLRFEQDLTLAEIGERLGLPGRTLERAETSTSGTSRPPPALYRGVGR